MADQVLFQGSGVAKGTNNVVFTCRRPKRSLQVMLRLCVYKEYECQETTKRL